MIKKENGITVGALVITIIVVIIVASIGIGIVKSNDVNIIETSDNIIRGKTYQDYIDATQMVISEAQVKMSTKEINDEYFYEIVNILEKSEQFVEAKISPVHYDITEDGVNISAKAEDINGVDIYTKEGYHILINEDLKIFSANNVKYEEPETADIEFLYSIPQGKNGIWSNKNVQVEIKKKGNSLANNQYTIQYKIGKNGDYQRYTKSLNISENCEIYARIIDKDRRVIADETKGEVDRIDKVNPRIIENISIIIGCSKVSASITAQDNESGLDKIIFYAKNKKNNAITKKEKNIENKTTEQIKESVDIELQPGEYNIYAEIYDKAENMRKTEEKQITAIEHNYAFFEGTTNLGTTHPTKTGIEYVWKCANCNAERTTHKLEVQSIDESNHYIYKCSQEDCQKKETHTWIKNKTNTLCRTCSVCGYKDTTHNNSKTSLEGVCTTCTDCEYQETIHAKFTKYTAMELCRICDICEYRDTVHDFDKWEITKKETCGSAGRRERKCKDCGYIEKEDIPATGNHKKSYLVLGTNGIAYSSRDIPNATTQHPKKVLTTAYANVLKKNINVQKGEYRWGCYVCGGQLIRHYITISDWKQNDTTHWKVLTCSNKNCGTGKIEKGKHTCQKCGSTDPKKNSQCSSGHNCTCGYKSNSSTGWKWSK